MNKRRNDDRNWMKEKREGAERGIGIKGRKERHGRRVGEEGGGEGGVQNPQKGSGEDEGREKQGIPGGRKDKAGKGRLSKRSTHQTCIHNQRNGKEKAERGK